VEQLIQTLSWIAAALQVPVVVAILYLLVRGLIALGAFYGLWSDRQRRKRLIDAEVMADPERLSSALTRQRIAGLRDDLRAFDRAHTIT